MGCDVINVVMCKSVVARWQALNRTYNHQIFDARVILHCFAFFFLHYRK